ncbi:pyridoxamine 5'-phosphate oxidase family protein [Microlunatus speluncae]|uniref:pyridoxamine 5'-phosphate oxidase family protein n=1 Tax=Microlunatus speluncae TaxID=2594267 RepID=UPI0012663003|nr:pyridoxamine 5'-phosphate oxidase family protein [Microlunatus speluncae]
MSEAAEPTVAAPRSSADRRRDTLHRLEHDVDLWVASGSATTGDPALVPLSFLWDGSTVLISTVATSPTARNLSVGRSVRLALGLTRDVIMIDATVAEVTSDGDIPGGVGDEFVIKSGFDPRAEPDPFLYFRLAPRRIQAWREANELTGRTIMINGRWR